MRLVCTIVTARRAVGSVGARPASIPEVQMASRSKAGTQPQTQPQIPAGTRSKGPLQSTSASPLSAASITVAVGFVALVICLVVFGSVAEGVRDKELFTVDAFVTPWLHAMASPFMDTVMQSATFLASNLVIPPLFAIAVVWCWVAGRRREALFLVIASGGSLILNETLKLFFARTRPQLTWATIQSDYSFPSGHTMNGLVFYVGLAIVLWSIFGRRAGLIALVAAIALSITVGVSRIYLGYHFFTDVVGGALAGTAWLLIVGAAFRTGPLYGLWRKTAPGESTGRGDGSGRKRS
jgi:undecaprenyl-diphosphatase